MGTSSVLGERQPLAPAGTSPSPSQNDVEAFQTPFERLEANRPGARLYATRFTAAELNQILHGNCPPPPGAPAGGRWHCQRMCYGAAEVVYIERGMCGTKWNPNGTKRCWIEQTYGGGCLVGSVMLSILTVAIIANL